MKKNNNALVDVLLPLLLPRTLFCVLPHRGCRNCVCASSSSRPARPARVRPGKRWRDEDDVAFSADAALMEGRLFVVEGPGDDLLVSKSQGLKRPPPTGSRLRGDAQPARVLYCAPDSLPPERPRVHTSLAFP